MIRIVALLLIGGTITFAQSASQTAQKREPFTLALTGDSIINQRLSVFKEPEFTKLFDMIRGADAAFTNLETLFHDYEMPRSFPADREYWDSVTAVTKWDGSTLVELELHPITLGYQTSRAGRGRPKLASPADAARILEMMVTRSKPFGATVTVSGGVGYVRPTPSSSR